MQFIKQLWFKITRSPLVVAAYTAALGAVTSYLHDALLSGSYSLASVNWKQMGGVAFGAALLAVSHLIAPAPGATPVK